MILLFNAKPPSHYTDWFHKHFQPGDRVEFFYNAGLKGSKIITGIIQDIHSAQIFVDGICFDMSNIRKITKHFEKRNA